MWTRCGIVEKRKASKTRDNTASTYQRLAKSRLDLSSKDGRRLMVGVSAGLGTRRRPPCGPLSAVCLRSLATTPGRQTARNRTPAQNTEKTENKAPRHARGVCFLRIAQNLNIIAAPDKGVR